MDRSRHLTELEQDEQDEIERVLTRVEAQMADQEARERRHPDTAEHRRRTHLRE